MEITIQHVIDTIINSIPGEPLADTVDTVKTGDPNQTVTGIVTTFLASTAVIKKAIELGANFIITHEPTFYNHLDDVSELEDNVVYRTKRKFIDDNDIVIWRFHDHWHLLKPDGILTGIVKALGWEKYKVGRQEPVFMLPQMSVGDLVTVIKRALGCTIVRVVGDPDMLCSKIAFLPGSPGPEWQIAGLNSDDIDVLITGEVHDWDTPEFTRDAGLQGRSKALIVIGHANSEEAGMAYLVDWLQPKFKALSIIHVPVGDPFLYL